jgi:hypothetical protein
MTPAHFALRPRYAISMACAGILLTGCGGSDTLDVATDTQVKSVSTRSEVAGTTSVTDGVSDPSSATTVKQLASTLSSRVQPTGATPVTKSTSGPVASTSPTRTTTSTVAASAPLGAESAGALSSLPLVQAGNLKYLGAFRLPAPTSGSDVCSGFSYGGIGLTFNPAGNGGAGSLLATGHTYCSRIGEFTIPAITQPKSADELQTAKWLQPATAGQLVDGLEGKLATSGITGGTHNTVNGLLVYGNRLAISGGNSYTYTQPVSHWSRPLDLAARGQVSDATSVVGDRGYSNARFTAGYMCHIPSNLQTTLGGPALTGWVADSIVSGTSNGPAAFSFDPNRLAASAGSTVPAKTLLFYPYEAALENSVPGQIQEVWNWTSIPRGCAVPNGTRTVMFIGRHGTGEFQYGVGGTEGHTNNTPQVPIYDPSDNSTGEHAWPYRYQVWAYDASDLDKVARGLMKPHQVRPYSTWRIDLPFTNTAGGHGLGGIAYDPKTRRLFIVQETALKFGEPLIHTFIVDNATAASVTY